MYAECEYQHKLNPYRLFKLDRKNGGRNAQHLLQVIDDLSLKQPIGIHYVLTFPKELSQALAKNKNGEAIAWRQFQRFWANCLQSPELGFAGASAKVNLHTGSSKTPLRAHFHFHILLFNQCLVKVGEDEVQGAIYELRPRSLLINEDGKRVVFTKAQLSIQREVWKDLCLKTAKRHGVCCSSLKTGGDVDFYLEFKDLTTDEGKVWLTNRFKYQKRRPMIDYDRYAEKHLKCHPPTKRIQTYTNRTRTFGWLQDAVAMGAQPLKESKEKLSPYDNKPLIDMGKIPTEELSDYPRQVLVALDFHKGKAVEHEMSSQEIDKLQALCRWPDHRTSSSASDSSPPLADAADSSPPG